MTCPQGGLLFVQRPRQRTAPFSRWQFGQAWPVGHRLWRVAGEASSTSTVRVELRSTSTRRADRIKRYSSGPPSLLLDLQQLIGRNVRKSLQWNRRASGRSVPSRVRHRPARSAVAGRARTCSCRSCFAGASASWMFRRCRSPCSAQSPRWHPDYSSPRVPPDRPSASGARHGACRCAAGRADRSGS